MKGWQLKPPREKEDCIYTSIYTARAHIRTGSQSKGVCNYVKFETGRILKIVTCRAAVLSDCCQVRNHLLFLVQFNQAMDFYWSYKLLFYLPVLMQISVPRNVHNSCYLTMQYIPLRLIVLIIYGFAAPGMSQVYTLGYSMNWMLLHFWKARIRTSLQL